MSAEESTPPPPKPNSGVELVFPEGSASTENTNSAEIEEIPVKYVAPRCVKKFKSSFAPTQNLLFNV